MEWGEFMQYIIDAVQGTIIKGDEDVLPEWSELGPIFIDGLKFIALIFIWFIPLWILVVVNALVDQLFLNILVTCCSLIYGIPFSLLVVGAFGLLADDRPFGEVINPMNAYKVISANWASTLIAWLLAAIGVFAAIFVGTLLCGIGILLGVPYGYALTGHLYGQLYSQSQEGGKAAVA